MPGYRIDVRYEATREGPRMESGRPMLTWGRHPMHGNGWTLWSVTNTGRIDDYFIAGDLTDVEQAVSQSQAWLRRIGQTIVCDRCGHENSVDLTTEDGHLMSTGEYMELLRRTGQLLMCAECSLADR
jgi:hypothetical protein